MASVSSPMLAQEAVQTPGARVEGLPWGDVAVVLAIVFIVMGGLSLFSLLERR
jgi:hypothetical protein